jgi:hypothetical protein
VYAVDKFSFVIENEHGCGCILYYSRTSGAWHIIQKPKRCVYERGQEQDVERRAAADASLKYCVQCALRLACYSLWYGHCMLCALLFYGGVQKISVWLISFGNLPARTSRAQLQGNCAGQFPGVA